MSPKDTLTWFIRKMSKNSVLAAQIEKLADSVKTPPVPLALRSIGTLVLGITRIYDRKTYYIYQEAIEVSARARAAERPTVSVDLPPPTAASARSIQGQINLPEHVPDFDQFSIDQELRMEMEEMERGVPIAQALPTIEQARRFEEPSSETGSMLSLAEIPRSIRMSSPGLQALISREIEEEEEMPRFEAPEIEMPAIDYPDFDVADLGAFPERKALPPSGDAHDMYSPPQAQFSPEEATEMKAPQLDEEGFAIPLPPARVAIQRRRKHVQVDAVIELTDTQIRGQLLNTTDTWTEQRPRATMVDLVGRANWIDPQPRLGSAIENLQRARLPILLDPNQLDAKLLVLFRRDALEIEQMAAPKRRKVAGKREAPAEAAAEEAAEFSPPAAERAPSEEVSPRGIELPDFDIDIDLGGLPVPKHHDEEAPEEEDRFRIEQARGVEASPTHVSDRSSFFGERLDVQVSPFEPRMSIGAGVGSARAATAAAMGAPASASSRRSRVSMLQSPAEREKARRSLGLGAEEFPDFGVPESQFELPEIVIESEQPIEKDIRYNVSRVTQIFRDRLDETELKADSDAEVGFIDFMRANTIGTLNRREVSLGFMQVLVLKTLDVISVEQPVSYEEISIGRGRGWQVQFEPMVHQPIAEEAEEEEEEAPFDAQAHQPHVERMTQEQ